MVAQRNRIAGSGAFVLRRSGAELFVRPGCGLGHRSFQHRSAAGADCADLAGDGADAGPILFVINALMFYSAAALLNGFQVQGFSAALIGSLLYTLIGMVINSALESLFFKR